jgi:hypothetical protein
MNGTLALPQKLVPASQLHHRFGPTPATWRRWAAEGVLHIYKLGPKRHLFDLAEVERFVAASAGLQDEPVPA